MSVIYANDVPKHNITKYSFDSNDKTKNETSSLQEKSDTAIINNKALSMKRLL